MPTPLVTTTLQRWSRKLRPTTQWKTHYLLTRQTDSPPLPADTPNVTRMAWVNSPHDKNFTLLAQIGAEQSLDAAWCRDQLAAGDRCILALLDDHPIAMGLITQRRFWVEEILHWFDPKPDGAYLYATYVSPPHRGRRIQRSLDTERLRWAASIGLSCCHALVEKSNTPSLRSHHASGFHLSARIDRLQLGRFTLINTRRLRTQSPISRLIPQGLPIPTTLHLSPSKPFRTAQPRVRAP